MLRYREWQGEQHSRQQLNFEGGNLPIVERLLEEGAEVNAPVSGVAGRTALQAAAEGGHLLIVERLLKEGAKVNTPASYSDGKTGL